MMQGNIVEKYDVSGYSFDPILSVAHRVAPFATRGLSGCVDGGGAHGGRRGKA